MSGAWPAEPVVYELNTAAWLHDVGARAGRSATLGSVPDAEWDAVTPEGVDAVWLMGVWQRSPVGVELARPNEEASWHEVLPDLTDADVIGSAYCIRSYVVDDRFGGRDGLAAARAALAARGKRLLVDFVPNHVAPDHPWIVEHPDRFVQGTADSLAADPAAFIQVGSSIVARGRDPYFAPWPDVAQLDAFAPSLRSAVIDTLADIAAQADGVRCDMAMLMISSVFTRTWGALVGAAPATEYWADVIGAIRAEHPDFLFVAEAYWDMEWDLQQLGFDHCYDKRLYDRLLHEGPGSVRGHLQADLGYQRGLIRFIENHDEPRAAAVMSRPQSIAAAVMIATLPGATLWHEGQFDGWKVRLPVFLGRRPAEPSDAGLREVYLALIAAAPTIRVGEWSDCAATGWPGDSSCEQLVTWCWRSDGERSLVVVNLSGDTAHARVHVPWDDLGGRDWRMDDVLTGAVFERSGDELASEGLYVGLAPWGCHVLRWT